MSKRGGFCWLVHRLWCSCKIWVRCGECACVQGRVHLRVCDRVVEEMFVFFSLAFLSVNVRGLDVSWAYAACKLTITRIWFLMGLFRTACCFFLHPITCWNTISTKHQTHTFLRRFPQTRTATWCAEVV